MVNYGAEKFYHMWPKKGATTFSITTLSITTLSIMTLSIKGLFVALSINDTQHMVAYITLSIYNTPYRVPSC